MNIVSNCVQRLGRRTKIGLTGVFCLLGFALNGLIMSAVGASAAPSFAPAQNYGVGLGSVPIAVAVGYINGDTNIDLTIADAGSDTVAVLLGNGDGTFRTAVHFPAGGVSPAVTVADFNRDGKPDLAVANAGSGGRVAVLLGNGDGTFGAAVNSPTGFPSPYSLTAADFNSDSKPDLAVSNQDSPGIVSVLLGNGDGTFGAAVEFAVGVSPLHMAVGDFNSDGKPDLAVANADSANVLILLGNGDGTFQSATNFAVGFDARAPAVGDFNSDGKPDLAVANGRSNNNQVLLNNGTGNSLSFQPAVIYPVGLSPVSVVVDDFNCDGKLDLASADADSHQVSVLLGNSDGTFQGAVPFGTGFIPFSVAVGDFNGDSKPDLVTANRGSNNISVLLNNCFTDSDEDGVPDNEDQCPNSDSSATVVIDGCNSGVPNIVSPGGCKISDLIAACAERARNHGQFVSCVSHLTNDLKRAGIITGQQKGAIQSCAARADIP